MTQRPTRYLTACSTRTIAQRYVTQLEANGYQGRLRIAAHGGRWYVIDANA